MGVFSVPIEIGDPWRNRFERLDALVDTGATFTLVPASLLDELGVEPERKYDIRVGGRNPTRLRPGRDAHKGGR